MLDLVAYATANDGNKVILIGTVERLHGHYAEFAVVGVERYLKGSGPRAIVVVGGDPYTPDTCDVTFADRNGSCLLFVLYYDEESGDYYADSCSMSVLSDSPQTQEFLGEVQTITGAGSTPGLGLVVLAELGYLWKRALAPMGVPLLLIFTFAVLIAGLWLTRNRGLSSPDVSKP